MPYGEKYLQAFFERKKWEMVAIVSLVQGG